MAHDSMTSTTGPAHSNGVAVALRPGVHRPDWSVVTQAAARAGLIEKWSARLDEAEDLVWRCVLELFPALGRAPRLEEIASATKMQRERLAPVLRQLQRRDL